MVLVIITEKGFVEGIGESAMGTHWSWKLVELQDATQVRLFSFLVSYLVVINLLDKI